MDKRALGETAGLACQARGAESPLGGFWMAEKLKATRLGGLKSLN